MSSTTQLTAFDDQVAATLADAGEATTGDVRRQLGYIRLSHDGGPCKCRCGQISHQTEWWSKPDSSDVRSSLRRLSAQGLCIETKTRIPNNAGGHPWLWLGAAEEE